jgi:hypothetical protein
MATRLVWITILGYANFTEKEWIYQGTRVTVPSGTWITTQEHLAELSGVSRKQVRNAIKDLIALESIRANQRANRYTEICIVNWPIYQSNEIHEGQPKGQERANQGPTKGQDVIRKEGKKKNLVGDEAPTLPLVSNGNGHSDTKDLVLFWASSFEKNRGKPPVINWGKHMRVAKTILAAHSLETAKWMVMQLIERPTDQARDRGWYDLSVLIGSTGNTILSRKGAQ